MAVHREKLLSSRSAAMAAKDDFVQHDVEGHRDRAAGIGLNSQRDDWALKVLVRTPAAASGLPKCFHDLDVDIEMIGTAHAQDL